jgi:orotidine-5'-phosphate decarboxylase
MKFLEKLDKAVQKNSSLLCVGLDISLSSIPAHILKESDPVFSFNKAVIEATGDLVCAYKPNMAFYEALGGYGLDALLKTIEYVPKHIPVILDAKRGDIGSTSAAYAKTIFEIFKADATTVNPYMGFDSIEPFWEYQEKGVFILCLTSNPSARDFQFFGGDHKLYLEVARKTKEWNKFGNLGLVVGATKAESLGEIRNMIDDLPILIPGIGTQGGDLENSVKFGTDKKGSRAIFNVSRAVIYASTEADFAERARNKAKNLRDEINRYRPSIKN